MYKILKRAALLAMALLLAGNVSAVRKDPYSSSRIFWDRNSEKTLFSSGNYARIIQLQDGRIMAAAEAGGGISVCYSSNYGQTWTSPEVIIRSANKVPYAVPNWAVGPESPPMQNQSEPSAANVSSPAASTVLFNSPSRYT